MNKWIHHTIHVPPAECFHLLLLVWKHCLVQTKPAATMFSAAWFSDSTVWVWPDYHAKTQKFSELTQPDCESWVELGKTKQTKTRLCVSSISGRFSPWSSAVLPRTELSLLYLLIAYGFQLNLKTYYWKHFRGEAGEMDELHFKGEIRVVH